MNFINKNNLTVPSQCCYSQVPLSTHSPYIALFYNMGGHEKLVQIHS